MKTTKERMIERGWSGVVKTIMTIHDVPFSNNPEELIPTDHELAMLRKGFNKWFDKQKNQ